jgi:hypothetical protein
MGKKLNLILLAIFHLCFLHILVAQNLPMNVPLGREMVLRGQLAGIIPTTRSGNLWPSSYKSMFSFDIGVNMDTVKNKFFTHCFKTKIYHQSS